MDSLRSKAKAWLDKATNTEINNVMDEALLSDTHKDICRMRKKDISIVAISLALHLSVGTVNNRIGEIYDMVGKIVYK